jgi:hypothetical protein
MNQETFNKAQAIQQAIARYKDLQEKMEANAVGTQLREFIAMCAQHLPCNDIVKDDTSKFLVELANLFEQHIKDTVSKLESEFTEL